MKKLQAKYWIPGVAIFSLSATEITLRLVFGFGNPALVQADPFTGYRFQPNQDVVRFGKRIRYNQYSQRSEQITLEKPIGKLRILMIGDSVLNGGAPIDQKQTITELFAAKLSAAGYSPEVLNASAGSWGIGNHQGYLKKFGIFNSDAVILEIGTNDLAQPTSTSERVGNDPNYPQEKPALAIGEVFRRYLFPQISAWLKINSTIAEIPASFDPDKQVQENLNLLATNVNLIRSQGKPIFVLFVPELSNLFPVENESKNKKPFIQKLQSLQVPVIDIQVAWSKLPPDTVKTYFRDNDHLTELGNQEIAKLLFQELCQESRFSACSPKNN